MSFVRKFNFTSDLELIRKWWPAYGDAAPDLNLLPPTGFISDHAAVFVIKTDTELCMLEHLIVDKEYQGDRQQAMINVCMHAIQHAKQVGFTLVWALSPHETVRNAAELIGFKFQDVYELFTREL